MKLFEKFNLSKNYLPGLPGISEKCEIIDKMVFKHLRTLHSYLLENAIPIQMYSVELICGLFGSKMSIDDMRHFYDNFCELGWDFFYALTIEYLQEIQFDLMEQDEIDVPYESTKKRNDSIKWKRIISKAIDFELSNRKG